MTIGSLLTQAFTYPSWTADKLPSLAGFVAIVTGASSGLGKVTALELARHGAHVFCVSRSEKKTQAVIDEIKEQTKNDKVEFLQADFLDLSGVEAAADTFLARKLPLDILVNNAGVFAPFGLSKNNIETQFATNHFAHAVFTARLVPAIRAAPSCRIVNLSSIAHDYVKNGIDYGRLDDKDVDALYRYAETKLANIHFTRVLQSRLDATALSNHQTLVNAVHPGIVNTSIFAFCHERTPFYILASLKMIGVSAERGATTQLYVAADPVIEQRQIKAKYFVPYAAEVSAGTLALDDQLAKNTWEWTEQVLQERYRKDWSWAAAGL